MSVGAIGERLHLDSGTLTVFQHYDVAVSDAVELIGEIHEIADAIEGADDD